ncbi:extracellular solute-binding protein [Micromonospora sp. C28SCA-DRY-2]|uniref:extracellular solute-binding protein n=1 Tax=Micromonospora sp. C28SCA-DRY-2 TaxID=3059522 RepID=UPI002674783D|nr:extracellular solute-binding protein [Micromonospora sp. C28SCA-DRY-2]MDO3703253.1 extracellular solute-binding protein [Micromonospora sp. C28SCA-DRY-2]
MNVRWAKAVAVVVAGLLAVGCAPSTAPSSTGGGDKTTGTLRVWLFDEPNRTPKERVVKEAITEFTAARRDVTVDVQYLAVQTRSERFRGAFNDPASAPDVVEFGNTDLPEYVAAGGLAELGADVDSWAEGKDLDPDLRASATIDGKLYGVPWYVGVRALYYRTDLFAELDLAPPGSQEQLVAAARKIRAAKPDLFGLAVGGKYTFGALPFIWDAGGDVATRSGDHYTAAINSPQSRAGIRAYTDLIKPDNCPPQQCADLTGGKTVELFASGKAGMAILGNFNRAAVEAGAANGRYAVLPLPGTKPGSIAPAFAGGNNLGIMRNTQRRTLAADFLELLASKKYQHEMYDAMGNLPTLTSARTELAATEPFLKPFLDTIAAGTRFVPLHPAWGRIDAQAVIPTMLEKIVTGQATIEQATDEAATAINAALAR